MNRSILSSNFTFPRREASGWGLRTHNETVILRAKPEESRLRSFVPPKAGLRMTCALLGALRWRLMLFAVFLMPQVLLAQSEDVPDPFEPKVRYAQPGVGPAVQQQAVSANLQGISINPKGAFAIISGELYEQGEEKLGIKVVQIRKREVDILVNGAPSTLSMLPEDMTRRRDVPKEETKEESADETQPREEDASELIQEFERE